MTMVDLNQLRKKVDSVDEQIMQALSERVKICKAIGDAKNKQKMPVKDADREKEVYQLARKRAAELSLDPNQAEAVYHEIVNMCSAVQEVKEK
jgi:chorismate mutase